MGVSNNNCIWIQSCGCICEEDCEYYTPLDENTYLENLLKTLRENNMPSIERQLTPTSTRSLYIACDDINTSDAFYVNFINDVLKQIREGYIGHVFKEYELEELLRFEPNLQVEIHDGIFYISLPLGNK